MRSEVTFRDLWEWIYDSGELGFGKNAADYRRLLERWSNVCQTESSRREAKRGEMVDGWECKMGSASQNDATSG